jgi:hypothetical protein
MRYLIFLLDLNVALERSTATESSSIDLEKFLIQYPQYSSIYESWQRLEAHMQVKREFFFDLIRFMFDKREKKQQIQLHWMK